MASPTESSLKASSLEKAKVELNEDPATRNDAILELKEAILSKEGKLSVCINNY